MKKIICTLMAIVMLLALCACGETKNVNHSEVEPTETVTEEVREVEFTLGETEGNTYKNAFLGLGYEKDDDWVYYTDEQIREINNLALDMTTEEVEELVKNANILYAMYAADENQINNININLEKLGTEEVEKLDIVQNYDLIIPTLKEAFEEMGLADCNFEHKKIYIDGAEFDALKNVIEVSGAGSDAKMYQLIFQKKCGEYLANITITTCFEDTTDVLLNNFFIV